MLCGLLAWTSNGIAAHFTFGELHQELHHPISALDQAKAEGQKVTPIPQLLPNSHWTRVNWPPAKSCIQKVIENNGSSLRKFGQVKSAAISVHWIVKVF